MVPNVICSLIVYGFTLTSITKQQLRNEYGNPDVVIKDATDGQFTWIIVLLGNPSCMGTTIDRYWVLTAAHCIEMDPNPSSYKVLSVDSTTTSDQYQVDEIHAHPDYKASPETKIRNQEYDIALLRLNKPFAQSEPVNISHAPMVDNDKSVRDCKIFGWTKENANDMIEIPRNLQYVDVSGHLWWSCMPMTGEKIAMMDNVICGISRNKARRPCSGNPGGPLLCKEYFTEILVGVSSWNFNNGIMCGGTSRYIDVGQHVNWIMQIIKYRQPKKRAIESTSMDNCNFAIMIINTNINKISLLLLWALC